MRELYAYTTDNHTLGNYYLNTLLDTNYARENL